MESVNVAYAVSITWQVEQNSALSVAFKLPAVTAKIAIPMNTPPKMKRSDRLFSHFRDSFTVSSPFYFGFVFHVLPVPSVKSRRHYTCDFSHFKFVGYLKTMCIFYERKNKLKCKEMLLYRSF